MKKTKFYDIPVIPILLPRLKSLLHLLPIIIQKFYDKPDIPNLPRRKKVLENLANKPCSFFSTSHFSNKNVVFQQLSNLRSIEYSFDQFSIGQLRELDAYSRNIVPLYFEVNVWGLFDIILIYLENWVRRLKIH